jgi:thymidine kinase
MNLSNQSGYLELIIGPMFSGKTSRLVEIYNQCKFCNISVVAINHSIDNRYDDYDDDDIISTHDKIKIPCIKTEKLFDVLTNEPNFLEKQNKIIHRKKYKLQIANSKVILINEGQFFPDLFEFVNELLKDNKQIYICGLDGDFERKKFGQIIDLIPLCDKVEKLTSLCSICKNGKKGIFSMRLSNEKEQTIVGSENYIPVCRECYMSTNKILC